MDSRVRGGAVALTAVVGLAGTASGCTGAQGAAAEDRAGGDPAEVVRRAADVVVRSGTAGNVRTGMEMAAGGTRVTIRGEGTYDFRGRTGQLVLLLPTGPAGKQEHRPMVEVFAPGSLYMKNRGAGVPADKWVRIETAELADGNLVTGGATDPGAAVELLRGARDVSYVGEDGGGLRHFRGTVELGGAARRAPAQLRGALGAAARGFSSKTVPFDAYLDDLGRVRKVRHQFSFVNGGKDVAVASTTSLEAFGKPVRVVLPPAKDIYAGKIRQ
ncbi:hypothetical protein [Streptomyces candidus]|uniref:Lipoprotein n=1 Tax=Streptomyces candidus TaxID=67283 RepID=A0A7X0HGJ6_9ACTN|nr:hypothetical protein [Streptomyces candidus]MBB6435773.1 hypothetical protein [Streptomyces candidus]GHH46168.1 lipoprotein [Streptomyces candidus]